jgi:hypothetical protein
MAADTNNSSRLFPTPRLSKVTSIPLSILDSTCARFSDTGAIWLFNASNDSRDEGVLIDHVKSSFVQTLNDFPQWAGQLHWAPFRPGGGHTERFNRAMITYGSDADPGVEWDVARHDFTVQSIVPTSDNLGLGDFFWDGGAFPQQDLLSPGKAALSNLKDFQGLPCVLVRISLLACGGYGVGIRIAHPLADAVSLMTFVHRWSAYARSGTSSSSLFADPVFNPAALDARAAGDIDAAAVDADLAATARTLPINRFSWWDTHVPGYSPWLVASTQNSVPPPDVLAQSATGVSPATTAPWHTWDLTRSVSYGLVHFSGAELRALQQVARNYSSGGGEAVLSRTDALMAHVFRLVNRARARYALADGDEVFLNVTLDARRRVAPPLPATLIGSPLFLAHVKGAAARVREAPLGALAAGLRGVVGGFSPPAVAALLHDAAHEVSPQRLWGGFMGSRHVIATSWQRLRVYEVGFEKGGGGEARPAYVHAVMQKCDGIVAILDSAVPDEGVDLAVYLDAEAMGHFKEELRKERVPSR